MAGMIDQQAAVDVAARITGIADFADPVRREQALTALHLELRASGVRIGTLRDLLRAEFQRRADLAAAAAAEQFVAARAADLDAEGAQSQDTWAKVGATYYLPTPWLARRVGPTYVLGQAGIREFAVPLVVPLHWAEGTLWLQAWDMMGQAHDLQWQAADLLDALNEDGLTAAGRRLIRALADADAPVPMGEQVALLTFLQQVLAERRRDLLPTDPVPPRGVEDIVADLRDAAYAERRRAMDSLQTGMARAADAGLAWPADNPDQPTETGWWAVRPELWQRVLGNTRGVARTLATAGYVRRDPNTGKYETRDRAYGSQQRVYMVRLEK